MDTGIVTEREEHGADGSDEGGMIAARQIGPADRAGKQRVPHEQILTRLPRRSDLQADPAGTVTRRVVGSRLARAERDDPTRRVELVDGWLWFHSNAEHGAELDRTLVQKQVVAMKIHRHVPGALRGCDAGDVVDMGVREEDEADGQRLAPGEREQARDLVARIDQHGLARVLADDHETVLEKGADGLTL